MAVTEEIQSRAKRVFRASEDSVLIPQVMLQAGSFAESSTQTIQEGIVPLLKCRRVSSSCDTGEEGHSEALFPRAENQPPTKPRHQLAAEESGNERGAGAVEPPQGLGSIGSTYPGTPSASRQQKTCNEGKRQSTQTAGALSRVEGQGSQAQPPQPLPTGRCSTNQAKIRSGRHGRPKQKIIMCSKRGGHASEIPI